MVSPSTRPGYLFDTTDIAFVVVVQSLQLSGAEPHLGLQPLRPRALRRNIRFQPLVHAQSFSSEALAHLLSSANFHSHAVLELPDAGGVACL